MGLRLSVLKFFPSSLLGGLPALEALAGPFPGVRFFPSGGVDVEEARLLLASPLVLAVGASWLASRADVAAGDSSALAETARAALERVRRPALPLPALEQRDSSGPIVTLGETLALFHTHGSLAHAGTAEVGIGGAESNVAIALVRLGAAATWIGVLGTDSAGDRVLRELRGEGSTWSSAATPGADRRDAQGGPRRRPPGSPTTAVAARAAPSDRAMCRPSWCGAPPACT